jgi:PAS domain S-box-containing protein
VERLRARIDQAPDAILIAEGDRVVDANDAAVALFARPRTALVGRPVHEILGDGIVPAADRREVARGSCSLAREGGLVGRLEWSSARTDAGEIVVIVRDVTERARREELWEHYKLLSESAEDIVLFVRRDGTIFEANEAAARAYGWPREGLVGRNVRDLRAPETLGEVGHQIEEAFARGIRFETTHVRRDGSRFPVEASSRSAIIGGEPILLSIIRDLSGRNAMQARLVQADRLAAVGTLAAGVAHEINNPLAYAITNLEVLGRTLGQLRARLAGDATGSTLLAEIDHAEQMLSIAREGTDRVRAIVRDLRTFSRDDDAKRVPVDVRVVLDSCAKMAAAELRHRAHLVRKYDEVPFVDASEGRLAQVFLNLLVNAAQAFAPGEAARHEVRVTTRVDRGGQVVVEIADDGPGIPPEIRARIFEPFVTTKPAGEGTGLGLFISREITQALGGTIEVESEVGRGTTTRVRLPPSAQAGRLSSIPAQADASPAGDTAPREGRLLVIDDEDSIALSIRRALAGEWRVVTAASGHEGLALLEGDRDFDAVVCDLMMPDLDGASVHAAVRRFDPRLAGRFVFMTGGAVRPSVRDAIRETRARLLEKPFSIDDLRTALRRVST